MKMHLFTIPDKGFTCLRLACLLAFATPVALYGQRPSASVISEQKAVQELKDSTLPIDKDVRIGKLSNGLTYYLRANQTKKASANFILVNKVGSVYEQEHERGLAHFTEHMAFNGTKNFPGNSLIDYLEKQGVKFGSDLNAYTSFDETVYHFTMSTADQQVVHNGLKVMRDWAGELSFDQTEIDQERGVIIEEKRTLNTTDRRLGQKRLDMKLRNSLYTERSPIGLEEVIKNFKREDIVQFYRRWYRPDRQAIIIVGDIDVDQMEQELTKQFASLPKASETPSLPNRNIPLKGEPQFEVFKNPESAESSLAISLKRTVGKVINQADFKNQMVEMLWHNLISSRLMDISQADKSKGYKLYGSSGEIYNGIAATNISMSMPLEKIQPVFTKYWTEVERIKRHGFTQEEFDRARSRILQQTKNLLQEKDKLTSDKYTSKYQRHFLDGTIPLDIETEYALLTENFKTLTLDSLHKATATWLNSPDLDIFLTVPENSQATIPSQDQLQQWMQQAAKGKLEPFIANSIPTSYIKTPLTTRGKIISKEYIPELDVTKLKLANGVQVILKPTSFKNNEIILQGFSPGGTTRYKQGDYRAASYATGLISASGLNGIDANTLLKMHMDRQLLIGPNIDNYSEGIGATTTSTNLVDALQLTYLYFTSPQADDAAFEQLLTHLHKSIEQPKSPIKVFQDSIVQLLFKGHYLYKAIEKKEISALNKDKMLEIYKERFANAADFKFLLVGSFDIDSISPLLETYLGSLPASGKKEQIQPIKVDRLEGKFSSKIYKEEENRATVILYFSDVFKQSAKSTYELQALRDVLEKRIMARLREKESGIYTPQISLNTSSIWEPRYTMQIIFACNPEQSDRLTEATLEEIRLMQTQGVQADDLAKFKSETLLNHEKALHMNRFWLTYLKDSYIKGQDPTEILSYPKLIQEINEAAVTQAAQKYLNLSELKTFTLLPKQ
ncbi:M16 family metallopeptidase [Sphingobacterium hotanense]|uniref:M16 family metallopeptidase n=1 Tax=Sphingobacterium hotanense TaxID=649196 RepID=UPI0011F13BC7|nr:insulinase family protein [Sphingobacterium hotanense]